MTLSVAHAVADLMESHGIRQVFGIPGVDNLALYQALDRSERLRSMVVRNEATAALAADAYNRVSGEVAACVTTGGPGVAYAAVGLGEAMSASSSLLHLATGPSESERGSGRRRGVPHWFESQESMAPALSCARYTITDLASFPSAFSAALRDVTKDSAGPVFVEIAKDLLALPAPEPAREAPAAADEPGDGKPPVDVLAEAWAEICRARRPVIWLGSGALSSDDLALRLAERLGAPVLVTLGARRRLSDPGHRQIVAHPPHEPAVGELLSHSDCVVSLGSDMDLMTLPGSVSLRRVIAVNHRPADASFVPGSLLVSCDVGVALGYFLDRSDDIAPRDGDGGTAAAEVNAASGRALANWADGGGHAFTTMLDRLLPPDAVVVCDMCIAGYWAAGYLPLGPRRQLVYPGWGTLGFGLGAAIGAACGRPDTRTVLLSGDGGIQYLLGELATIREHSLPITIVVVDDGGYGMLRAAEAEVFDDDFATSLRGPEPQALGAALDLPVHQGSLTENAETVLHAALGEDGPSIAWLSGQLSPPAMALLFKQQ